MLCAYSHIVTGLLKSIQSHQLVIHWETCVPKRNPCGHKKACQFYTEWAQQNPKCIVRDYASPVCDYSSCLCVLVLNYLFIV